MAAEILSGTGMLKTLHAATSSVVLERKSIDVHIGTLRFLQTIAELAQKTEYHLRLPLILLMFCIRHMSSFCS